MKSIEAYSNWCGDLIEEEEKTNKKKFCVLCSQRNKDVMHSNMCIYKSTIFWVTMYRFISCSGIFSMNGWYFVISWIENPLSKGMTEWKQVKVINVTSYCDYRINKIG